MKLIYMLNIFIQKYFLILYLYQNNGGGNSLSLSACWPPGQECSGRRGDGKLYMQPMSIDEGASGDRLQ